MSQTFVPAQVGVGPDTRTLSVLLRSVAVEPVGATPLELGLFLLLAIAVGLSTYYRPAIALAWIIISAPCAAFVVLPAITLTVPQVVLIAAVCGLLARARLRIPLPDRATRIFLLLQLGLVVVIVLSTLGAKYQPAALIELWKAFQYVVTFCAAWTAFTMEPDSRYARYALAGVTLTVCALALAQEFSGAPSTEAVFGHIVTRIAGPLDGPNQLGAFLGLCIPVLGAYAVMTRRAYLEMGAAILGSIVLALTLSRGSLIALVVAALVILVARYAPRARRSLLLTLGAAFILFFMLAVAQFIQPGPHDTAFNGGLGSRSELWRDANLLWRTSPVLGIGPANFELRLAETGSVGLRTHANSAYFQSLAETGIAGFLLFAAVLAYALRRLEYASTSPLLVGIFASTVGMAFHQIVDVLTFYPKVGVLFWALLGCGFAIRARLAR